MLTVPGMAATKGLQMIWEVQKQMVRILNSTTKGGFQGGAVELSPSMIPVDRLEQAMDLLLEASKATGFVPGTDFHIGIDCAAHEIYDIQLGHYEVLVGAPRTADQMLGMYLDLLGQYPALSALIDPLCSQDTESWTRLAEQAPSCPLLVKVAGDDLVPGKELPGNGVVLPLEDHDTLSSLLEVSQALRDDKKSLVLAGRATDGLDYSLVDLAVGLQARWLKLGLLSWADHTAMGNRLAQVGRELLRCGTQDPLLVDTSCLAAE
uniref:enolase 4 n=1 Tax=Myxine glutinosa TaxID=7769 RepID=UPI00358EBB6F